MTRKMSELKKEHFVRKNLDQYHYYYFFGVPGFEICLEPCAAGFDVAVYTDDSSDGTLRTMQSVAEPKRCTETGDYTTSAEALFGDRKDEDWNKALVIANEMLDKYKIKERQDVKAKLAVQPEIKGNDLITAEEIKTLRTTAQARTLKITCMQDIVNLVTSGKLAVVIPMPLKSGYCASFSVMEADKGGKIELLSVGSSGAPDAADAESIARAVLGTDYKYLGNFTRTDMVHFISVKSVKEVKI